MSSGRDFVILTHGAGSNRNAPLLVAVERALVALGVGVERVDMAYRLARPTGPPRPDTAVADRAGLRQEVEKARRANPGGRVFLGGHSYGGRQSTMLAAEEPGLVDGLLLMSYPLHPPRKPQQLRTAHLPLLQTASIFVHGTRDPFGSIEELREALKLIPARTNLLALDGAGHDLAKKGPQALEDTAHKIADFFGENFSSAVRTAVT